MNRANFFVNGLSTNLISIWRHTLLCLCGLFFATLSWAASISLPNFDEIKKQWKSSDVIVLDRHGEVLQRVRVDLTARRLEWVNLDEVSPALLHALVLSEDKRFYEHSGVDWSSVASAAWGNLWNSKVRGASTLTMQLVGLLDADWKARAGQRSVWQKMGQSAASLWLEKNWTKEQILEAYLNLVSFRGEQVGLPAISAFLFDKMPIGLNAEEAALLAALLRAPNAKPEKIARRACRLLPQMELVGMTPTESCERIQMQAQNIFARKQGHNPQEATWAPHFTQRLLTRQAKLCKVATSDPVNFTCLVGTRMTSTLDANLQRYATMVLRRHLSALATRHVQDGAVVVLDNQSGEILAWVGSSGRVLSTTPQVDMVNAERQAGSILKPFLYQLAIQERWLTAASLLDDSPLDLQTHSGIYAPENYAKDNKGLVSVRTALAASLNVPAVRALQIVSPQRLRDRLVDLGVTSLIHDGDYYGYSLALGAAEVRLIEITNAYRALANQGLYSQVRWTISQARNMPIRKLDASSSFIIADILSDRTARARTFGLESVLATPYWSAVKTGTSKDMRDNWTIGFSQQYTVGVWVGNTNGEPMWDVSGMHGAAPIWQAILSYLHQDRVATLPIPPRGVIRHQVQYDNGVEATRQEWFLSGTQRGRITVSANQSVTQLGIAAPLEGSIYALDPDIPKDNQRMIWRAQGVHKAKQAICHDSKEAELSTAKKGKAKFGCTFNQLPEWWLNGKYMGKGETLKWLPWPGQHQLELRLADKTVIQTIHFSVRGAVIKTAKAK